MDSKQLGTISSMWKNRLDVWYLVWMKDDGDWIRIDLEPRDEAKEKQNKTKISTIIIEKQRYAWLWNIFYGHIRCTEAVIVIEVEVMVVVYDELLDETRSGGGFSSAKRLGNTLQIPFR